MIAAGFRRVMAFGKDLSREIHQFEQNVAEKFRADNEALKTFQPVGSVPLTGTFGVNTSQAIGSISYTASEPTTAMVTCTVQAHVSSTFGNFAFAAIKFRVDGSIAAGACGATSAVYSLPGAGVNSFDDTLTFCAPFMIRDTNPHVYDVLAVTDANSSVLFGKPQEDGVFALWVNA